eukprot:9824391-Lingulodinium_polyedra.AAC.1
MGAYDTVLLRYMRAILRGLACTKTVLEDVEGNCFTVYKGVSSNMVWKRYQMVPTSVELRVRR